MLCQGRRIVDPRAQRGCTGVLRRLYNSDNRQLFPVFHKILHICFITGFICPHLILAVILIAVRTIYQTEYSPYDIIIRIGSHILRDSDIFFIYKLLHHLVKFERIP